MPSFVSSLRNAPKASHSLVAARISILDLIVYAFILGFGVYQLTHYLHTADFLYDATYPDLARSLLEKGSYELRFLPQTTLPPGFSLILAIVAVFVGFAPAALFPVVSISSSLALVAAYSLLRRIEGRAVAAVACLLLASSPALFIFVTTFVYPEMTYFLLSMLALLLALKIDRVESSRFPTGWVLLLSFVVSLAVLVRSVGVAILMGLALWIAASLILAPDLGRRRFWRMLVPLAFGLSAQVTWSVWAHTHQTLEWQLPGYPQSYSSQLLIKDGRYPELGVAHLSDLPGRIERNVVARTAGFVRLVSRRHASTFWSSPAIIGVLSLVAVGLVSSLRQGGELHDWYFLCYEAIFALWPWDLNDRFLFPIVPLACLYLWRGAKEFKYFYDRRPKAVGAGLVSLGILLTLSSACFAFSILKYTPDAQHVRGDRLQPFAAMLFWLLVAAVGVAVCKWESLRQVPYVSGLALWLWPAERRTPLLVRVAAVALVAMLVVMGTARAVVDGRENMAPDISRHSGYTMIAAAEWIRTQEPADSIVMARDAEFIFHYAQRRVVWLPPISDPKVLMDGVRRYHVGVLLVVHHADNYWLPPEDVCAEALLSTYGSEFHLVHRGVDSWVYEVLPPAAGS
jgi:hypothetical protein